jgi:hypothetical protein
MLSLSEYRQMRRSRGETYTVKAFMRRWWRRRREGREKGEGGWEKNKCKSAQ